jgi:hypothetical protein
MDLRDMVHHGFYIYSGMTGLPETYTDEEVKAKSADVFRQFFYAHSIIPFPIYVTTANTR